MGSIHLNLKQIGELKVLAISETSDSRRMTLTPQKPVSNSLLPPWPSVGHPGAFAGGSYFYTQVMGFTILQVRWSELLADIKDLCEKA